MTEIPVRHTSSLVGRGGTAIANVLIFFCMIFSARNIFAALGAQQQVNHSRRFGPDSCGPVDPAYIRIANETGGQPSCMPESSLLDEGIFRMRRLIFMGSKMFDGVMIAAFSVFFISGMAFAKTKQVNVIYPAQVGRSLHLKPGNYRIDLVNNTASPKVKFYNQYGKLVGASPVKVVNELQKNSQTEIVYSKLASNKEALTEISPSGWAEKLVFAHAHQNSAMNR